MPTSRTALIRWPTLFMLAAWFVAGCDNKVPNEVKEPGAPGVPGKATASQTSAPAAPVASAKASAKGKGVMYCTEYAPTLDANLPAISEVSIAAQYTVVAKLVNLTVGKRYVARWKCTEATGQQVGEIGTLSLVSNTTNYILDWTTGGVIAPDYKIHKPGKWRWEVEVSDYGRLTTEIDVLPASPDELASLARYELARENVLRAMTYYWQGLDDKTFHTIISFKKKETPEVAILKTKIAEAAAKELALTNAIIDLNNKPGDKIKRLFAGDEIGFQIREAEHAFSQVANERQALEARLSSATAGPAPDDFMGYLQVGGMSPVDSAFSTDGLSAADRLNGIHYRASAQFTFGVFRFLREQGWTDWQDCQEQPNRFLEAFGAWTRTTPAGFQKKLNLNFVVMERDGNWFVTASGGDQFVNGKMTKRGSDWLNDKPSKEYALDLVNGKKSFTRESYRAMGEAARNDPAALEQSTIRTMNLLRGRPLLK